MTLAAIPSTILVPTGCRQRCRQRINETTEHDVGSDARSAILLVLEAGVLILRAIADATMNGTCSRKVPRMATAPSILQ
jgi:hypothetical protein